MARHPYFQTTLGLCVFATLAMPVFAQSITANHVRVDEISDNFDDPSWNYNYAAQSSANGKWRESFRGVPETLQRVATPAGGPAGSTGALSIRSVDNGKDAYRTQDDFLTRDYSASMGRYPARADLPIITTQVYLPPVSELEADWFIAGFRTEARSNDRMGSGNAVGYYYPSIWINYYPQSGQGHISQTSPYLSVRLGDGFSSDTLPASPYLPNTGWWTLGLSFDEAGIAYYYARSGTDELTSSDIIFDSTRFATTHASGVNPFMDSLAYSYFSVGQIQGPENSPNLLLDNFNVYRARRKGEGGNK